MYIQIKKIFPLEIGRKGLQDEFWNSKYSKNKIQNALQSQNKEKENTL